MNQSEKNRFFNTKHFKKNIKLLSIRGSAISLTSQGIMLVIGMASTIIMARLLTPKDFGLIAMVVAITGFADIFSSLGLSMSTIQRENINHAQVSTMFWINVAVSTVIMISIAVLSPAIAWFYDTPQLTLVTMALSVTFLSGGLAVQHKALLTRQMRFTAIATVEIIAMIFGIGTAIYAAMHNFRYWALVINNIVSSVALVLGLWLVSGWLPGRPVRGAGLRSILNFGIHITGFNILNYFSRNLDNILIGRFCGASSLGFYSKAYQLLMLPVNNLRNPLNNVVLPSLSRMQNDPKQYRSYYIKFISILAFISMPLIVFLFVCSENIVILVLGNQWLGVNKIFKILAIAALIQPIASSRGLILLSLGRSQRYFRWGLFNAVTTVISFIIGISWGATGVAIAYVAQNYLILYPSLWYVYKNTPIKISDFFGSILRPAILSFIMGFAGIVLQSYLVGKSNFIVILDCFLVCTIVYLIAWAVIPGGRSKLRDYFSYCALLFSKT
jgi:O-antigen/teichoic acid export membrane protein